MHLSLALQEMVLWTRPSARQQPRPWPPERRRTTVSVNIAVPEARLTVTLTWVNVLWPFTLTPLSIKPDTPPPLATECDRDVLVTVLISTNVLKWKQIVPWAPLHAVVQAVQTDGMGMLGKRHRYRVIAPLRDSTCNTAHRGNSSGVFGTYTTGQRINEACTGFRCESHQRFSKYEVKYCGML